MNNLCEKHKAAFKNAAIRLNLPVEESVSSAVKGVITGIEYIESPEILASRTTDCPICFEMENPCNCGQSDCDMSNPESVENSLINTTMEYLALNMHEGLKQ